MQPASSNQAGSIHYPKRFIELQNFESDDKD